MSSTAVGHAHAHAHVLAKRGSAKTGTSPSTASLGGQPWWIVLPLVLFFFCAGIYVGSVFVRQSSFHADQPPPPSLGLPRTNNVLRRWSVQPSQTGERESFSLRRSAVVDTQAHVPPTTAPTEAPHKLLRVVTDLPVPEPVIAAVEAKAEKIKSEPRTHSLSLHADEQSFLTVPATAALDAEELLVGCWLYLDEDGQLDHDMRTVFSNKQPGCESARPQQGVSLFVNAWQSSDHRLYLEYGGARSGCHKLDAQRELQRGRWYHVAALFGSRRVALFIDGELANAAEEIEDAHVVQNEQSFVVGQYSPSSASSPAYPLYGNVSDLAVVHFSSSFSSSAETLTEVVQQLMRAKSVEGQRAFFSLTDAVNAPPQGIAKDSLRGLHGRYTRPLPRTAVAGVKISLVDGVGGRAVTAEMQRESDTLARERRVKIKEGMQRAWQAYRTHAWGRDELKPLSKTGQDNWGGMGVTLVDSLDTLWLMGLRTEFDEAAEWVRRSLTFDRAGTVSVFETTIRELGGLLAAYDLSRNDVFLEKAKQLGDRLIKAFGTHSGIPTAMLNLPRGAPANGWAGNSAILSELGTLQVEFRYLSHHTKDPRYEKAAMKPLQLMARKKSMSGLFPIKINIDSGNFADSMVTFGALGDSFYEYLLKVWLQGGRKEKWLREMYDRAMDGAIDKLLMTSSPSGLAFLSDWNGRQNFRKMDHLVCFMPGLLALGAYTDPDGGLSSARAQRDLAVAKALMYTCREMYHRMQTGIAPEFVEFPEGRDMVAASSAHFYILRPETAESLFILHQLTGDPIYRDWAWEIWEAIDRHCRAGPAYGSLRDVNNGRAGVDDRMESFFLAETMKYLYLAQDPDRPIDLMKHVFNTEAHPLSIFDDSHRPVSSA